RERIEDPDEDLLVVRGDNWLSGEELDQEIDTALRVQAMQQQVVQDTQEQQP
ncbi:carbon storage regulator, partial [Pseudomonas sp. p99-361]